MGFDGCFRWRDLWLAFLANVPCAPSLLEKGKIKWCGIHSSGLLTELKDEIPIRLCIAAAGINNAAGAFIYAVKSG